MIKDIIGLGTEDANTGEHGENSVMMWTLVIGKTQTKENTCLTNKVNILIRMLLPVVNIFCELSILCPTPLQLCHYLFHLEIELDKYSLLYLVTFS